MPIASEIRVSKSNIHFDQAQKDLITKFCERAKSNYEKKNDEKSSDKKSNDKKNEEPCPRFFMMTDKSQNNWIFILQNDDYKAYPKKIEFDGKKWLYLSNGTYNIIYVDEKKEKVCRIPRDIKQKFLCVQQIESIERLQRLWPLMNPNAPKLEISTDGKSLIVPYFEGVSPTPKETHLELLDIYKRTGRIIIDGFAGNAQNIALSNFIKMKKPSAQDNEYEIGCPDYGFALNLTVDAAGPRSPVSVIAWDNCKTAYDTMFADYAKAQDEEPDKSGDEYLVLNTIQALLYIQENHPTYHSDYLKNNFDLIECFSKRYRSISFFKFCRSAGCSDEQIDRFFDICDASTMKALTEQKNEFENAKTKTLKPLLIELVKKIDPFDSASTQTMLSVSCVANLVVTFRLPSTRPVVHLLNATQNEIKEFLCDRMCFADTSADPKKSLYNTLFRYAVAKFSFDSEDESFATMTHCSLAQNYQNLYDQLPITLFPDALAIIDRLYHMRLSELNRPAAMCGV